MPLEASSPLGEISALAQKNGSSQGLGQVVPNGEKSRY
jgi:hypothetical protein